MPGDTLRDVEQYSKDARARKAVAEDLAESEDLKARYNFIEPLMEMSRKTQGQLTDEAGIYGSPGCLLASSKA